MDTKKYLSQIEKLDYMINNKVLEIQMLDGMATSISAPAKDVNVKASTSHDKMGEIACKLVILEDEVKRLVDYYVEKRKLIVKQIDNIEDAKMYNILYQKYILKRTWKSIEVEMNMSHRYMLSLHATALSEFEKKYGKTYLSV